MDKSPFKGHMLNYELCLLLFSYCNILNPVLLYGFNYSAVCLNTVVIYCLSRHIHSHTQRPFFLNRETQGWFFDYIAGGRLAQANSKTEFSIIPGTVIS